MHQTIYCCPGENSLTEDSLAGDSLKGHFLKKNLDGDLVPKGARSF